MEHPFTFVTPNHSKKCYVVILPNFENIKFDYTNQGIPMDKITIGEKFEYHILETAKSEKNKNLDAETIKKNVFKKIYEVLEKQRQEHKADYFSITYSSLTGDSQGCIMKILGNFLTSH